MKVFGKDDRFSLLKKILVGEEKMVSGQLSPTDKTFHKITAASINAGLKRLKEKKDYRASKARPAAAYHGRK